MSSLNMSSMCLCVLIFPALGVGGGGNSDNNNNESGAAGGGGDSSTMSDLEARLQNLRRND